MSHKYANLEDTIYFSFGSNDTSGSGDDGSTPVFDVRFNGDFASSAPVYSNSAILLTHANYPPGAHEIAVPATAANGFIASGTYSVFSTILVDSQNPTGLIGSFSLQPVIANVIQVNSANQTIAPASEYDTELDANISTRAPANEYDTELDVVLSSRAPANEYDTELDVVLSSRAPANEYDTELDANISTRAPASTALDDTTWTNARAGYIDELASGNLPTDIADIPTVAEFEARTLVSADYVVVSDTIAGVTTVGSVSGAVGSVTGAVGSVAGAVGSVTGAVGSVSARVTANTDQIAGVAGAATKLAASAGAVVVSAASSGTLSLTQMSCTLTETTPDHYKGRVIIWTSGNLKDQATDITAYTTGLLTFTGVTEAPADGDTFVIV